MTKSQKQDPPIQNCNSNSKKKREGAAFLRSASAFLSLSNCQLEKASTTITLSLPFPSSFAQSSEKSKGKLQMEKALTKVGSLKLGSSWIPKKAKQEFSNISDDISVSKSFAAFSCILVFYLTSPLLISAFAIGMSDLKWMKKIWTSIGVFLNKRCQIERSNWGSSLKDIICTIFEILD